LTSDRQEEKIKGQDARIKELETENRQLRDNQQKLIKENEQLRRTVESMKSEKR
jgi:predicted RNase H-like nuclease (RuvC/YqgF family)